MTILLDENDNNSLMILINKGMEKDAKNLIYGYDSELIQELITQVNKDGETPLLLACKNDMKSLAELLCSDPFWNLKMDNVNQENETALLWACFNNLEDVACQMINNNMSNILHINSDGNTLLIMCCCNSMEKTALLLLEKDNSNIDHINKNKGNALMWACHRNLINVIKKLIECKCNIKYKRGKFTPLNICFKHGNDDGVIAIINSDPNVLQQEEDSLVMEILEEYYDQISIKGKLKGENLMKLLSGTMFEYMLDFEELVKYKEKNGELRKLQLSKECLFCMTETDYSVCFDGCYHVIHVHKQCINEVYTCPICRRQSKYFECFVD